jgi:hypothetical protein
VLGQYDKLDAEELLIKERLEKEIEKNGPESAKAKKFEEDLQKVAKERQQLAAKEKELRDLALREMPATGKPAVGKPGAGS